MRKDRFLHPNLGGVGDRLILSEEAAHHVRVLRTSVGDRLVLFDGCGLEADVRVVSIDTAITCENLAVRKRDGTRSRVVLILALPKGQKLDDIVRSTTEAGVAEIHLAESDHAVPRPDRERMRHRMDRLRKIATEASRQSEREIVPTLFEAAPLFETAERAPSVASRLVLSARQGETWDRDLEEETWIVIGPEGGLSDKEEETLMTRGWRRVRLALPVLRVETAAPIAVAMVVDHLARP